MSPLMGRPALEGPHLVGRALVLLAALLCASAPASQLLAGSSWLTLTLTGAAPVILGGVVLRQVLKRPMLVPLAQAALIVVLVVVIQTLQGLLSWSSGPVGMVRTQAEIFTAAVNELANGMPPVALGPHGLVLVVLVVALLALLLDVMYLDLGWHTPTGLLLMGAILLPALQQPAGGPWWTLTLPVLAGATILATRTVHADPRYLRGDRRPQAGPTAHPLRTAAVTAVCVALVAGLTPLLGPALPQLAPPRIALNVDLLERWQDPDAPALGPVMIDDDVSVRRSLLQQQDTEVLRYTTTAEDPSYLRLRSLNTFDGEAYRGDVEGEALALGLAAFSDSRDDGVPVHGSADDFIETDVEVTSYAGDRLPVPDNVRSVEFADSELDESVVAQPSQGEIALARGQTALVGQRYTIRSEQRTSSADALRSVDPAVFDQPFDAGYTSREEVPETASELADTIAESARADNAFDTAVAYQDYFRNTFAYSLTVNTAPGEDPLESFLADRIGYCEQFAAAFALMMTSQGYPSRVVIGFTAGEQDGDQWTVSAKNAHAWPEVWFGPEHGWVRFEPTPAAAANGVSTPGVTDAAAQQDTPEAPGDEEPTQEEPTEEEPTSEEGTTEESSSEEGTTEEESDEGGAGPSEETVDRIEGGVVTTLALGALLAAAAALTVLLIRRRRARAREQRWAALFEGGPGSGVDGDGGGAGAGAGGSGAGGADGTRAALAAERMHRRAGALAWSEITRELAVRETAIRWLAITGAWGRPPTRIALDPTLPPARALEDLLDQIDAGEVEVSAEDRAAAARIAAAYTSATYAPPLPEGDPMGPEARPTRPALQKWGNEGAITPVSSPSRVDVATAQPSGGAGASSPASATHPLRLDADRIVALVRTAR